MDIALFGYLGFGIVFVCCDGFCLCGVFYGCDLGAMCLFVVGLVILFAGWVDCVC